MISVMISGAFTYNDINLTVWLMCKPVWGHGLKLNNIYNSIYFGLLFIEQFTYTFSRPRF